MVKFRRSFRNYQTGETASFTKDHEKWLIEKGIAQEVKVSEKQEQDQKPEPKGKQTVVNK